MRKSRLDQCALILFVREMIVDLPYDSCQMC